MSAVQTWRVVLAPRYPDGAAEERQLTVAWVERFGGTWTCGGHGYHRSPRRAVMMAAFTLEHDAAEILAPGELTRAERAEAIIEGRTAPPTDAEIEAHWRAGGTWVVEGVIVLRSADAARSHRDQTSWAAVPWVPMRDGRPCAWPVASEGGAS